MSTAVMTNIYIHGPLGERFGNHYTLQLSSLGDAIKALSRLKKGFLEAFQAPGAGYTFLAGETTLRVEDVHLDTGGLDIHIVPWVEGAKDGSLQMIIGIVIAAAAFYFSGPAGSAAVFEAGTTSGAVGGAIASFGISMAVGGLVQMLSAQPPSVKTSNDAAKQGSVAYDGAVNTIGQNNPVQVLYGFMEIGSSVVATQITNSVGVYTQGTSEGGFDPMANITDNAGAQVALSTEPPYVLGWLSDGTISAAEVVEYRKGFSAVYTVITDKGTLALSEFNSVMRMNGYATGAELAVGDVLRNGAIVQSKPLRTVRTDLTTFDVKTNLGIEQIDDDGRGNKVYRYVDGPDFEYVEINGIPCAIGVYMPPLPNDQGYQ